MPRPTKTKLKTPDAIMKANMNKMLNKMKIKVAEKEEIWLDTLHILLGCMISHDTYESDEKLLGKIRTVSLLTDEVISCYEARWGNDPTKPAELL